MFMTVIKSQALTAAAGAGVFVQLAQFAETPIPYTISTNKLSER
jgi:hypothetical protein